MAGKLHPPGGAWQPLIEACVVGLAAGGLDLGALWASAAARKASLGRLARLLDLVVTWNARVDLTAARDARELVDLYLADALVLAAADPGLEAEPGGQRWIDVGSGAGAPGLVLQLLRPELDLTLVEPRAKRVAFLRSALGTLLSSRTALVLDRRSDALPEQTHDVAVSRATFGPSEWLAEGARLSRGRVWVLLARAEPPTLPGWHVVREVDYSWPLTGVRRHALAFGRAP